MTQILTGACPEFIVQVSDRLVVAKRGNNYSEHDRASNKTVVYRATDALVTIGYSGLAYIGQLPTDRWIAETLCGQSFGPPDERFGVRFGDFCKPLSIGQAIIQLNNAIKALPPGDIDAHGLEIMIGGWQAERGGSRPILLQIARKGGRTRMEKAPRRWDKDRNFRIGWVGVPPAEGALSDKLAKHKRVEGDDGTNGPFLPDHLEQVFLEIIRETSEQCVTVGAHALSVILMKPGLGPAGCRFHPLVPQQAEVTLKDRKMLADVAQTPWMVAPGLIHAPTYEIGHTVVTLAGCDFHVIGSPGQSGLDALSSSIRRPPPPSARRPKAGNGPPVIKLGPPEQGSESAGDEDK